MGEYRDGQLKVLVFLHVEVDEGAVGECGAIQRTQRLGGIGHGFIESPRGVWCDGGRDLDRDVIDIGTLQQRERAVQTTAGFFAAQHRLAEQVQVESNAVVLAQVGDDATQPGVGGVHDQVADHGAQNLAGDRHDNPGQQWGEEAAQFHQGNPTSAEEFGYVGGEFSQARCGHAVVLGTNHLVHETNSEVEPIFVAEQTGQSGSCRVYRFGSGGVQPFPN